MNSIQSSESEWQNKTRKLINDMLNQRELVNKITNIRDLIVMNVGRIFKCGLEFRY